MLEEFLSTEEKLEDNYAAFLKLKEKFQKEGIPENIATYKASTILTPYRLEKIKLIMDDNIQGLRPTIEFCFDKEEDLVLLAKYFNFNPNTKQVRDSKLLISILKLMEELDGKL